MNLLRGLYHLIVIECTDFAALALEIHSKYPGDKTINYITTDSPQHDLLARVFHNWDPVDRDTYLRARNDVIYFKEANSYLHFKKEYLDFLVTYKLQNGQLVGGENEQYPTLKLADLPFTFTELNNLIARGVLTRPAHAFMR